MKIDFNYDVKMEWDNLNRGLNSKNNPENSLLVKEMIENGVDLTNKIEVIDYCRSKLHQKPMTEILSQVEVKWRAIEQEAVCRMVKIFGSELDSNLDIYLTINQRCGYNIDKKYFFVSISNSNTNGVIIHELLHFFTHKYLLESFKAKNIDRLVFNDYKEALTFLINTEFSDLLDGWFDRGYDRQQELRQVLQKKWQENKDIYQLTDWFVNSL